MDIMKPGPCRPCSRFCNNLTCIFIRIRMFLLLSIQSKIYGLMNGEPVIDIAFHLAFD